MRRNSFVLFTTLMLFMFVGQLQAAAPAWVLDKAHSNIYFSVDHIFSKVNGHFKEFETDIKFDPKDLSSSQFFFEITTSSIDTYLAKRDKHLQSADFFDASQYPTITFKSDKVLDKGNQQYDIVGKLTVKDKVYDLTLPLTLAGVKDHPAMKGKLVTGFNGKIILDRLAYNIGGGKFYEMGVVGKDVAVMVSLELTK